MELARAVCARLGWTAQFISIKSENAYVELSSGNVDCAWGGLTLDPDETDLRVLTPYLTDELVIITRADTGAKSLRGLKGAASPSPSSRSTWTCCRPTRSSWTASAR